MDDLLVNAPEGLGFGKAVGCRLRVVVVRIRCWDSVFFFPSDCAHLETVTVAASKLTSDVG